MSCHTRTVSWKGAYRYVCLSAAWLGPSSSAYGYLKQKLAEMAKSLDPALCQVVLPTAVLQTCGCLCVLQGFKHALLLYVISQAAAKKTSPNSAW